MVTRLSRPSLGSTTSLQSTQSAQRTTRTTQTQQAQRTGFSTADSFESSSARTSGRTALRSTNRSTTQSTARQTVGSNQGTLRKGQSNSSVKALQQKLNASGFDAGSADGKFGPKTERAVRDFQRANGLRADGIAGRRTFGALNSGSAKTGNTSGAEPTTGATSRSGTNGTASLNNQPRGKGMTTGSITVNGHTYQFNSGGRNKFSTPQGEYRVTAHRQNRSDAGFVRDGVGFSFKIEDARRPGSDQMYDSRAGRQRTNLRIHPDGGAAGTSGCIGIVGNAATLRQFRADMNAELQRNGGSYTLRVQ